MSAERVEALRKALLARGVDPETINDMVMGLGGEGFTRSLGAIEHSSRRAEQVIGAGPIAAMAGIFEYETLLSVLGVDSTKPGAVLRAVSVVHHLMDHSAQMGCQAAVKLIEQDPMRLY